MPRVSKLARTGIVALALTAGGGCASAKFIQTGKTYQAKQEDCVIEVFSTKNPERAYEELGIIEGQSGVLGDESLSDILPPMKKEACKAGGDAIILTSRDRSVYVSGGDDSVNSSEELNIVATVIRWTE